MSSTGMHRGRVGCSAAALATEADRRPSSFKAGTSRTICGPPPLTVGRVGEAILALYYKSEQSCQHCVCNKPAVFLSLNPLLDDKNGSRLWPAGGMFACPCCAVAAASARGCAAAPAVPSARCRMHSHAFAFRARLTTQTAYPR